MTTEEKMMRMFDALHGDLGQCTARIIEDEYCKPIGVEVLKDGNSCWWISKEDIIFDYITRKWDDK